MDIPQDPSDGIRAYIKILITSKLREGLPLRQISDLLNLEVLNLAPALRHTGAAETTVQTRLDLVNRIIDEEFTISSLVSLISEIESSLPTPPKSELLDRSCTEEDIALEQIIYNIYLDLIDRYFFNTRSLHQHNYRSDDLLNKDYMTRLFKTALANKMESELREGIAVGDGRPERTWANFMNHQETMNAVLDYYVWIFMVGELDETYALRNPRPKRLCQNLDSSLDLNTPGYTPKQYKPGRLNGDRTFLYNIIFQGTETPGFVDRFRSLVSVGGDSKRAIATDFLTKYVKIQSTTSKCADLQYRRNPLFIKAAIDQIAWNAVARTKSSQLINRPVKVDEIIKISSFQ